MVYNSITGRDWKHFRKHGRKKPRFLCTDYWMKYGFYILPEEVRSIEENSGIVLRNRCNIISRILVKS